MSNDEWVKYICRFCDKELTGFNVIPPRCKCEGYKNAWSERRKEIENEPDYEPPLEPGEYDKKYPQTYIGEKLILDEDGSHKIKLEARKYDDGEALCIWRPFAPDPEEEEDELEGCGLALDITDNDAKGLYELLSEYLGEKDEI